MSDLQETSADASLRHTIHLDMELAFGRAIKRQGKISDGFWRAQAQESISKAWFIIGQCWPIHSRPWIEFTVDGDLRMHFLTEDGRAAVVAFQIAMVAIRLRNPRQDFMIALGDELPAQAAEIIRAPGHCLISESPRTVRMREKLTREIMDLSFKANPETLSIGKASRPRIRA